MRGVVLPRSTRAVLIAAVCCALSQAFAADAPPLSDAEKAEIYGAVVTQLITRDDTFDGHLHPHRIFIERQLGNDCPYPEPVDWREYERKRDAGKVLPPLSLPEPPRQCSRKAVGKIAPAIEAALRVALADSHVAIVFVDGTKDLRFVKRTGEIVGGGVSIKLNEIAGAAGGKVATNGSIYIARLAAGESRYEFAREGEHWILKRTLAGMVT